MERTGWRDEELSLRHHDWGKNCPTLNIDSMLVEFNTYRTVGFVEYKRFNVRAPRPVDSTVRVLLDLAERINAPFWYAHYWPGIWAFRIRPQNFYAQLLFTNEELLCERDYVARLYRLRGLDLDEAIRTEKLELHTELPGVRSLWDDKEG